MNELVDEIITVDYENLNSILHNIPLNKRIGLKIILNDINYEFLVHMKSDSDTLLCLGPSGLPNMEYVSKFKTRPVFTRHTWQFNESVILYNDNTRYVWDGCTGSGWGIGLPGDYFLENIKNIILKISEYFKISNNNILFYGSSMGGFTSIQLATMIKNSHAIAENPQIDARKWMKNFYIKNGMYSDLYDEKNLSKFELYKLNVLEMIKKENYIPNMIILNDVDKLDLDDHLTDFIKGLYELPFKDHDYHKIKIIIEPIKQHTPIPKERLYEIFYMNQAMQNYEYFKKIDYGDVQKSINIINEFDLFDEEYYLNENKDIPRELDPLTHYLLVGWKEGRNPSNEFDTKYYLNKHDDIKRSGINPLVHYAIYGRNEKRVINEHEEINKLSTVIIKIIKSGLFDEEYYSNQCLDLEGLPPLEHYLLKGWKYSKNPSINFDNDDYLDRYDSVKISGMNPLIHYISYGINEGKTINKVNK